MLAGRRERCSPDCEQRRSLLPIADARVAYMLRRRLRRKPVPTRTSVATRAIARPDPLSFGARASPRGRQLSRYARKAGPCFRLRER